MTKNRLVLFLMLVSTMFLVTACGSGGNDNNRINEYANYYKGKEGVESYFEGLPQRLYYYGPQDNSNNEFSFGVALQNKGASYTRGGIFVSGFDPSLLVFDEISITEGGIGACGFTFGNIGFGDYGGIFRCDGLEVNYGGDTARVRLDSLADLINAISGRHGSSWWDPTKFDIGIDYTDSPSGSVFSFNIDNILGNVEYYQNGRLFIALLAGIDYRIHNGREFLLAADDYNFPGGETDYLLYNGKIVNWPPGLDQTVQSFLLTTCYQYTTYADPIVCIDPDPYSDIRKVCYPQSKTWNGGNGAPVAITSIEQENTPQKIIFRINVQNVGSGTVWDAGHLERCSPYYPGRVTPEHKNIVYLGDVRVGTLGLSGRGGRGGIECSPEVIRLDPKTERGTTTCSYPLQFANLKSAYQAPLVVELWYGYSQTQQRQVQIKRIV